MSCLQPNSTSAGKTASTLNSKYVQWSTYLQTEKSELFAKIIQ